MDRESLCKERVLYKGCFRQCHLVPEIIILIFFHGNTNSIGFFFLYSQVGGTAIAFIIRYHLVRFFYDVKEH